MREINIKPPPQIEFRELPPSMAYNGPGLVEKLWRPVVEQLIARPGENAVIFTGSRKHAITVISRIRTRGKPWDTEGGTVVASRRQVNADLYEVHAAYMPEKEETQ